MKTIFVQILLGVVLTNVSAKKSMVLEVRWIWGDAGLFDGKGLWHELARWNPLRWTSSDPEDAMVDWTGRMSEDRPVDITLRQNGTKLLDERKLSLENATATIHNWLYKNCRDKRVAADNEAYTYSEFIDYYGEEKGKKTWADATEEIVARWGFRIHGQVTMTKADTSDNSTMVPTGEVGDVKGFQRDYVLVEFGDHTEKVYYKQLTHDKRKAEGGEMYTYEEFIKHYGQKEGKKKWLSASKEEL